MDADHLCSAMLNNIGKIFSDEAIVDRNEHRSDLGNGVEGLKLSMRIGRDVGDAIALANAQTLEHGGPAITALAKLGIRQAQSFIDHSLAVRIQTPGATQELKRGQGCFHWINLLLTDAPRCVCLNRDKCNRGSTAACQYRSFAVSLLE